MTNQIAINNNLIKNMIANSNFGDDSQQNNDGYDKIHDINFFPGKMGEEINIVFKNDSSDIINIVAPLDATVKELLIGFYIKYQLYGKFKNKKIYNL